MWHPDEGTIHAWLDGALDPAEAARVEGHVASCAECAPAVAEARALIGGSSRVIAALDHEPGGVATRPVVVGTPPSRAGGSSVWRRLHLSPALAAAAAVLIVGTGTWLAVRQRSAGPAPMVVAEQDSALSPEDSLRRAYEEAQRRFREERDGSAKATEPAVRTGAGMVAAAPAAPPSRANETSARAELPGILRGDAAAMSKARSGGAAPSAVTFTLEDAIARVAGCYQLAPSDRAHFTQLPARFTLDSALVSTGPKASPERHYAVQTDPAIAGANWTLSGREVRVSLGAEKTTIAFQVPAAGTKSLAATISAAGTDSPVELQRCAAAR